MSDVPMTEVPKLDSVERAAMSALQPGSIITVTVEYNTLDGPVRQRWLYEKATELTISEHLSICMKGDEILPNGETLLELKMRTAEYAGLRQYPVVTLSD